VSMRILPGCVQFLGEDVAFARRTPFSDIWLYQHLAVASG